MAKPTLASSSSTSKASRSRAAPPSLQGGRLQKRYRSFFFVFFAFLRTPLRPIRRPLFSSVCAPLGGSFRLHIEFSDCSSDSHDSRSFSAAWAALSTVLLGCPSSVTQSIVPATAQDGRGAECDLKDSIGQPPSCQHVSSDARLDRLGTSAAGPASSPGPPTVPRIRSHGGERVVWRTVLPYSSSSEFMKAHFLTFLISLEDLFVPSSCWWSGAEEGTPREYRGVSDALQLFGFRTFFPLLTRPPEVVAFHHCPTSRIQGLFSLLLEATVAVVPVLVSSPTLLHMYLLFLLRILGGRLAARGLSLCSRFREGPGATIAPASVAEVVMGCFGEEPVGSSCFVHPSSLGFESSVPGASAQEKTDGGGRTGLPCACLCMKIGRGSGTESRDPAGSWQEGHAAAEACSREEQKFGQLALTAFLAVVAAAPPDIVRQVRQAQQQRSAEARSQAPGRARVDQGDVTCILYHSMSCHPRPRESQVCILGFCPVKPPDKGNMPQLLLSKSAWILWGPSSVCAPSGNLRPSSRAHRQCSGV